MIAEYQPCPNHTWEALQWEHYISQISSVIMPHNKLFSHLNNKHFILSSWVSCSLAHLDGTQLSLVGIWVQSWVRFRPGSGIFILGLRQVTMATDALLMGRVEAPVR